MSGAECMCVQYTHKNQVTCIRFYFNTKSRDLILGEKSHKLVLFMCVTRSDIRK